MSPFHDSSGGFCWHCQCVCKLCCWPHIAMQNISPVESNTDNNDSVGIVRWQLRVGKLCDLRWGSFCFRPDLPKDAPKLAGSFSCVPLKKKKGLSIAHEFWWLVECRHWVIVAFVAKSVSSDSISQLSSLIWCSSRCLWSLLYTCDMVPSELSDVSNWHGLLRLQVQFRLHTCSMIWQPLAWRQ